MSDTSREAFQKWCKRDCSPGAEGSEWYWRIWQAAYAAGVKAERERAAKVNYAYVSEVTPKQRGELPDALWQLGDARLVWVNEGDIIEYGTLIERTQRKD